MDKCTTTPLSLIQQEKQKKKPALQERRRLHHIEGKYYGGKECEEGIQKEKKGKY